MRAPGTHRRGGWVDLRAGVDAIAKRINPIIATARNLTAVVQSVAQYLY
jgi:hypothetical protein